MNRTLVIIETLELDDEAATIELKPLQLCAVRIQNLLKDHNEKISMSEFEAAFNEKYKIQLCPGQYGFPGLTNLITALSDNFVIRGRGAKKIICIVQPGKNMNGPPAIQRYFILQTGKT